MTVEYGTRFDQDKVVTLPTGSKRSDNAGKPAFYLVPASALERVAMLYARGAEKYGERNWEKGQPRARFLASAFRHLYQYVLTRGTDTADDHLAAVVFNVLAIIHFEQVGWPEGCDTW